MVLSHFPNEVRFVSVAKGSRWPTAFEVSHRFVGLFRQPELPQLTSQRVDDGSGARFLKGADFPLVDEGSLQLQHVKVFLWCPGVPQLASYVIAIALQQVITERAFQPAFDFFWGHFVNQPVVVALKGVIKSFVPSIFVVNRFSHVVFLFLVDGVATATVAGGGVAFYLLGVSHER